MFFCDVVGTFTSTGSKVDGRENDLKRFALNLVKLASFEESGSLSFSFVSTLSVDEVNDCVIELKPYLDGTCVVFGNQYAEGKRITNGMVYDADMSKAFNIISEIDHFGGDVYYADDTFFNQTMTSKLASIKYGEEGIIKSFIPGTIIDSNFMIGSRDKGISGLNSILEEYINRLQMRNTNKKGK